MPTIALDPLPNATTARDPLTRRPVGRATAQDLLGQRARLPSSSRRNRPTSTLLGAVIAWSLLRALVSSKDQAMTVSIASTTSKVGDSYTTPVDVTGLSRN